MKVTNIKSTALSIPFRREFTGPRRKHMFCANPVIVRVETDESLEAFGLAYANNNFQVNSLMTNIEDLKELLIGQDVYRWGESWEKLWNGTERMGHQGYAMFAFSAIDSALWNLRAQALGMPLWKLLGGYQEKVEVYGAHKLHRNWTMEELEADAALLVEQGFRTIKMNMGGKPAKVELERLKLVRETVGEDINIMVDVNWAWTKSQAIQMGRKLEEYNIYWLEDPLASDDADDLAEVAHALDVPIAAGETFHTKYEFRPLFEKRAIDILIIDLQHVGGVTEWIKVAAMAHAWNIPVSSHVNHDFSAHLVGAIPNGVFVEYRPWWDVIYKEPPQIKDGFIEIPDKPGIGLELDPEAIKKYAMK